jgi:Secretion system C-terminal sorting domain
MNKTILFCLLLFVKSFAQSGYTVELTRFYCDWVSKASSFDSVETIIKDSNNNIIPPNSVYYEYHSKIINNNQDTSENVITGIGLNKTGVDNDENFINKWYVKVKDTVSHKFSNLISNNVSFQIETTFAFAKQIIFQAKRNGTTLSNVKAEHWMYEVALWNSGYGSYLTINQNEVLKSFPGYLSASNDKFNYWNTDQSLILNHNNFYITSSTDSNLIANYKPSSGGVAIKNSIEGTSVTSSNIQFKDPWYVDYMDVVYGDSLRNRGTKTSGYDALVFRSRTSPFYPDFNTPYSNGSDPSQAYRGVFLNQGGTRFTPPVDSVNAPSSFNYFNGGSDNHNHSLYFQYWTSSQPGSVAFKDSTNDTTAVVFKSDSSTALAIFKGTQLSNNTNAYLNNSQRKVVRTSDGTLHIVYESMGHVWYEQSTNSGSTWYLANSGKPLDINGGKLPAIDYSNSQGVAIVWEENYSGYASLNVASFVGGVMCYGYPKLVFCDYNQPYNIFNLNPVIAFDYEARAIIAWENKLATTFPIGIVCKYGALGPNASWGSSTWVLFDSTTITSSDTNFIHPTISAARNPSDQYNMVYNIAWEYYQSSSSSSIYAKKISIIGNPPKLSLSSTSTPSSGDGFWTNYNPTIVSMNDNTARLVWTGYSPWYLTRAIYRYNDTNNNWSSTIYNMGSNVIQSYINNTDDGYFVIGWVQNNGSLTNNYVRSDNINQIKNFSTTGNNLQINNAASLSNMYALTYKNTTMPYFFGQSSSVGSLGKITNASVSNGRAAVISYNGIDYCFGLGDIIADGQKISFVPIPDSVFQLNTDTLDYFLRSNAFNINNNSKVTFSLFHGMIGSNDTAQVISLASTTDFINMKVVVVDAANNNILSQISNEDLKNGEMFPVNISGYNYNYAANGAKAVKIELLLSNNIPSKYTINDFFSTGSAINLLKSKNIDISYQDNSIVSTYSLEQNYPNPFNPTTVINYQLPQDGYVTLKVYDILGREIVNLVNAYKTKGRYSVTFNASNLASGVYIYQLKSGDYSSNKKLILMK